MLVGPFGDFDKSFSSLLVLVVDDCRISTKRRSAVILFAINVLIVLKSALARSSMSSELLSAFYTCLRIQRELAPTFRNLFTRETRLPPQNV